MSALRFAAKSVHEISIAHFSPLAKRFYGFFAKKADFF